MLNDAIALASEAHKGQTRLNGEPYIYHCLRVMMAMGDDYDAAMVAILHDVVEDTHVTIEDLEYFGYPKHIVDAVATLTRSDRGSDIEYMMYIRRVAKNPLSAKVKLADIEDNTQLNTIPDPIKTHHLSKYIKHRRAKALLKELMSNTGTEYTEAT